MRICKIRATGALLLCAASAAGPAAADIIASPQRLATDVPLTTGEADTWAMQNPRSDAGYDPAASEFWRTMQPDGVAIFAWPARDAGRLSDKHAPPAVRFETALTFAQLDAMLAVESPYELVLRTEAVGGPQRTANGNAIFQAVPEPSAALLLSIGTCCLLGLLLQKNGRGGRIWSHLDSRQRGGRLSRPGNTGTARKCGRRPNNPPRPPKRLP